MAASPEPAAPLTCCMCSRPAVGRVYDMIEALGEDKRWHWQQSPQPRGFCTFHEGKCSITRWIDRERKVWESEPPARR